MRVLSSWSLLAILRAGVERDTAQRLFRQPHRRPDVVRLLTHPARKGSMVS
jgi:hypothetical protein